MVEKKTDAIDRIAIDHIVKLRDRLVVERLRFGLLTTEARPPRPREGHSRDFDAP